MSYKGTHKIDGYFEYVVPPLEGVARRKQRFLTYDEGICVQCIHIITSRNIFKQSKKM